jgi:SAM-dependent methyltransferase
MVSIIEHSAEGIPGLEEARKYGENHRKYAGLTYRPPMKALPRFGLSGRYLEVGAGPGSLAAMIAEEYPKVNITTIDISRDMVRLADDCMKEKGIQDRVRSLVGDVGDRAFLESLGKFDLVYSTFSVHHWKDPELSVANIRAAVRDGGVVYLYDLNRLWWLRWLRLLPFVGRMLRPFEAAYSCSEMRALLQKAGAQDFEIRKHYAGLMQSVVIRSTVTDTP